jgi:hypothetical protein
MSLAMDGKVWKLLPADAGVTVHYNARIYIKELYWFNPTASGDDLLLVDMDGNTIWKAQAEANNGSQSLLLEGWYNGLVLTTLTSGELYIYIG